MTSKSLARRPIATMPTPRRPELVLTTASVPKRQRLAFWRDYVCQTIAGVDARPLSDAAPYAGRIRAQTIPVADTPGYDLLSVQADAQRVSRTRDLISVRTDDSWLLMIQDLGTCAIAQEGRQATLVAGDIAFLDTSRPYEVTFPEVFRQSILKVPAALFRDLFPMRRDVAGMALSGNDALVQIARHNLLLLDRLAQEIDPAFLPAAAQRATDHLALAMRAQLDGASHRSGGDASALHFSRATEHIAAHLHEPALSVQSVARAIGLSTGHLHEVFRAAAATTVGEYIRRRRLAQCRRELADQSLRHQSITSIAYRWGFSEASSFSRAFRTAYQTSPRHFRQNHELGHPR
ncbi:helix-turn-helix domain-containing protein [Beijerinckia sp. L45]|uniref:helix-turn-helix domain-containing protein n=1 Tax=Beijerinckia sp. L45 TaxID=1641855 RepID=UPI00131CD754|nr:helix-turn-helix domain-containing protein [Beijerinckia sp. L45]